MRYTVPVIPCPYGTPGHFRSEAIVCVAGSENGPAGYSLGGWTAEGRGRLTFGADRVPGPHAYLAGNATVIDMCGGTARARENASGAGLLFHVAEGDEIEAGGLLFRVGVDRRGYPTLAPLGVADAR